MSARRPYEIPDEFAPLAERLAAYRELSAVELTLEQIETVMAAPWTDRLRMVEGMGFADPAVALAAIQVRWEPYLESADLGGFDWKTEDPEYYATLPTMPLDPYGFGLSEADLVEDDTSDQAGLFPD